MHQTINSYLAIALVASVALGASLMIIKASQIEVYSDAGRFSLTEIQ